MNKMLFAGPFLLLATTPAFAQVMTPAEYVKTAGAGDLYERTSSKLVLESTANPKIREFAQMMIGAHTKSTADVTAAARASKIRAAPPQLTPGQTELIAQLKSERGSARDATYIAQQRTAHGQALAVQKGYAANGTAPALKRAAAAIVPVVEQHVAMLKTM